VIVEKCMVQRLVIDFIQDLNVVKSLHFYVLFALINHIGNLIFKITRVQGMVICLINYFCLFYTLLNCYNFLIVFINGLLLYIKDTVNYVRTK